MTTTAEEYFKELKEAWLKSGLPEDRFPLKKEEWVSDETKKKEN